MAYTLKCLHTGNVPCRGAAHALMITTGRKR